MYVVVVKQKDGKIELTKEELQKMLDDAYAKGKEDERNSNYCTITCGDPWNINKVYYSTTCASNSESATTVSLDSVTLTAGK